MVAYDFGCSCKGYCSEQLLHFAEKSNIQKPQPGLGAVVERESLCEL